MFKKISDSYAILGDEKKRESYDRTQFNQNNRTYQDFSDGGGFGFEDFINTFGSTEFRRKSSDHARKTQGRTHSQPPAADHLNIYLNEKIELADAMLGKKINLSLEIC